MDFLKLAFESLPVSASHPYAFIAYLFLIASWVVVGWKARRNRQLLKSLEKLPSKDRLSALKAEMGTIEIKEGLSPEQWLKHRQTTYYFAGFIALCIFGVIIFSIAITYAKEIETSRNSLIEIISHRESNFVSIIDKIILQGWPEDVYMFENEHISIEEQKKALTKLKADTLNINSKRRSALLDGNLVLAHELANELDELGSIIRALISTRNSRLEEYKHLYRVFSGMSDEWTMQAEMAMKFEQAQLGALKLLENTHSTMVSEL